MKKNEFLQIKGLNLNELKDKAKTLKGEVANLVLDKNMKKLKDLKIVSKKKKEIAQILTLMRQKELLAQLESESQKEIEHKKKEIIMDDSAEKTELEKKGRTKLSKTKK